MWKASYETAHIKTERSLSALPGFAMLRKKLLLTTLLF